MEKHSLNTLREMFLKFFEEKGHYRMESAPLVPKNDSSLLLINSGMAPLKPYFMREVEPPAPRATTCQKCIRTPDIESVGKDARHGTYFEMLGNFSFGDYFKKEATAWAWEFITQVIKLPVDKLYVSVYEDDDEAWDIWTKDIGVEESHMVRLGKKDNFWEIGSGPCGPCSEIYFDRGEKYKCDNPDCAVGCDCDRYVEFWNLVFSQFNSDGKGTYTPLEHKNIDTGMGLERLACIVQEVPSLFDVDTIANITKHASEITGVKYGDSPKTDVSLRIITDHIRSTSMMVCDGVMPSNAGRGYVLRRLLRRAARHGRLLGVKRPFLYEICDTVIRENEGAYPQLREKEIYIKTVIKSEEERFAETVEQGLLILDEMVEAAKAECKTVLPGDDAFKLYDTYGFPIDLTVEILEEQGMGVDREAFDELMRAQRKRAKDARGSNTEIGWESDELSLMDVPATKFVGYTDTVCNANIVAVIKDNERSGAAGEGDAAVILDTTAFYATSGGQLCDKGVITCEGGEFEVKDVKKTADGRFIHTGVVTSGELTVGQQVECKVDTARRAAISRAHSTTHLLQKTLRTILGDHVEQAGSLVEPDKLRFDFTHFAALSAEEIAQVEAAVNDVILSAQEISCREMPIEQAKALGAMALFGEKYGDTVRVVTMGDYSMELCGGIHMQNTAQAGSFKIVSESSVAAGVRRIEAVCGKGVLEFITALEQDRAAVAGVLKTPINLIATRASQLMAEIKELSAKVEALESKIAASKTDDLIKNAQRLGAVNVITAKIDNANTDSLRAIGDMLRDKDSSVVCVLASVADGKISFAAACGKDAVAAGAHAGNLLKTAAKICGGGGGGRPDSATAGGKDASKLDEALQSVYTTLKDSLK